jgi:hypothetical protein
VLFLRALLLLFALCSLAQSQQTVLNVPSADVLDRGKAYFELDTTLRPEPYASTWEPRLVFGLGDNVEAGVNFVGLNHPGVSSTTIAPAIKWKAKRWPHGWALLLGDDLFVPVQHRRYTAGNYVYAEVAKTFASGTRVTAGAFHFSPHVVSNGQRAGGQFALEQPLSKRATFVADWFTGDHANGYVSIGAVLKITPRLTFYPAYMIGNHRIPEGNHQFEFELGWNFN